MKIFQVRQRTLPQTVRHIYAHSEAEAILKYCAEHLAASTIGTTLYARQYSDNPLDDWTEYAFVNVPTWILARTISNAELNGEGEYS